MFGGVFKNCLQNREQKTVYLFIIIIKKKKKQECLARCFKKWFFKIKNIVWIKEFVLFLKTMSYFYFINLIYNSMKSNSI